MNANKCIFFKIEFLKDLYRMVKNVFLKHTYKQIGEGAALWAAFDILIFYMLHLNEF